MVGLRFAIAFSLAAAIAARGENNGRWQTLAPLPHPRQELATAALNGKIYVIGGLNENTQSTSIVEVYDPATNQWSSARNIPVVTNHNAAAVAAGKLYSIAGGSMHVYDPVSDSWSQVASPLFGHSGTPAVGVYQEKIYIAGGEVPFGTRNLEVYDPATNTWSALAQMTVPRNHTGGGFIDGKFYVVGGRGQNSPDAPTALEAYDPQTNTWERRAPMPTPRSGFAVAAVKGELFVFGGELPAMHAEVEAYNPVTNTWRSLPFMPFPRHGIWASVIGNKVYIPGGAHEQGFNVSDVNDVFIVEDSAPAFANISTRGRIEAGDNVLIGGFIVTGTGAKRIIVRARGPSVPVGGALPNPRIELFNGAGALIAANDDWQSAPNKQEISDSTLAPPHELDAAILTSVTAGNYTAVVSGVNGATGVGLVEIFDLAIGPESRLANISTRGFIRTGDNVLIGGLILDGQITRKVLVRAIGPSLGRSDAMADPTLELHDANGGLLADNDNWRSTQEIEIMGTTIPPKHDLEAAIVQTLAPASYTAIVRGVNGGVGIGLVEAYALE